MPEKPHGQYPEPPPPYSTTPNQPGYAAGPHMPGAGVHHPPPRGGVPVFPMAGYPPQPPTVVLSSPPPGALSSVTVVNVAQWGPYPMQVSCPRCSAQVMTETNATPGLLTWLLSGALIFLGCWIGCCLVPCCIPECQDIEHRCPNCKSHLGTFRRM